MPELIQATEAPTCTPFSVAQNKPSKIGPNERSQTNPIASVITLPPSSSSETAMLRAASSCQAVTISIIKACMSGPIVLMICCCRAGLRVLTIRLTASTAKGKLTASACSSRVKPEAFACKASVGKRRTASSSISCLDNGRSLLMSPRATTAPVTGLVFKPRSRVRTRSMASSKLIGLPARRARCCSALA